MLNSCASGVSVVNIDNGFGAGYLASIINSNPCAFKIKSNSWRLAFKWYLTSFPENCSRNFSVKNMQIAKTCIAFNSYYNSPFPTWQGILQFLLHFAFKNWHIFLCQIAKNDKKRPNRMVGTLCRIGYPVISWGACRSWSQDVCPRTGRSAPEW